MLQSRSAVAPYTTKDGSEIRELMHPSIHGNQKQSLAEATIPVGARTLQHKHCVTEELYHITQGIGRMILGTEAFEAQPGDTICIKPGTVHSIENIGAVPLVLLCCCSPPYSHDDTILT